MVTAVAKQTTAQTIRWPDTLQRVFSFEEAPSADGLKRSWIMLFPVGTFNHPEYGDLHFTAAKLAEIKRNFDNRVRHIDIALDAEHDQGQATGWLEQVQLREQSADGASPAGLWGLVCWTPLGMKLLQDRIFRYFSPEFGPWTDPETGTSYQNVLMGGGLTNRPFLKQMPALTLADVSTRPWGSVDKAKLPDSCFLDPSARRLPIYEGAGAIGADGRYTKRGKLNINGVRAALAAVHGAHTGKPMSGLPAGTVARLERLAAKYSGGGDASSQGASEGGVHMAKKQQATAEDTALVFMGGDSSTAGSLAKAPLGAHAADDDMRTECDDGTELDDTSVSPDDEMYAEADEADGDGADAEDGFDAESDTHGAMTTDSHAHGKFGAHAHDGDGNHADAPLKRSKAMSKKASEPGSPAQVRTLREQVAAQTKQLKEMQFRLYERDVTAQVDAVARKLGDGALSRVFTEAYKSFMLDEGFRLSEELRGKIAKLCDLALRRGVVDLRSLGSSFDQEARRTVKSSDKGRGTDAELSLLDQAIKLAESEGKIKPGQSLGTLKLAEREEYLSRAAKETGYNGAF